MLAAFARKGTETLLGVIHLPIAPLFSRPFNIQGIKVIQSDLAESPSKPFRGKTLWDVCTIIENGLDLTGIDFFQSNAVSLRSRRFPDRVCGTDEFSLIHE
jgi:hypothetical protein